ncbi:hypothetical protein BKA62DRAFT_611651, partial [Auriculariales sp. MPI-PUGE-AT-0066]
LKEIYKERAVLERDYALKLQALARRGHEKQAKLTVALSFGETPTKSWGDGAAKKSTFDRAYDQLLTSFEQQAMDHLDLSESLSTQIIDGLRRLEHLTEERQTRQKSFYAKVLSERDRYASEQLNQLQYYEECKEFELYRQKQGRAQGDRHADRAAKQYEHQKVEMLNYKNLYVVNTASRNIVSQRFYESDIPRLEDMLQARLITDLVSLVKRGIAIHTHHLDCLRSRHLTVEEVADNVDPAADQALFIEFNRRPFSIPGPLQFEACPDFYDTGDISVAGESRVFLQNKLARSKMKLSETEPVVQHKQADIAKYLNILPTGPPNADEVVDNLVEAQHSLTLLEMHERALNVEQELISGALGGAYRWAQPHNFKSASFSLPSPCAYCQASIWGLSKQGKTCKDCGLSVHMKCELKVAANCPRSTGRRAPPSKVVMHGNRGGSASECHPSWSSLAILMYRTAAPPTASVSAPTASTFTIATDQKMKYRTATIQFDYTASSPFELSVAEGSEVDILEDDDGSGWVKVQDPEGQSGLIPASYLGDDATASAVTPRATSPMRQHQPTYGMTVSPALRGIYDYTAQGDDEMSITTGQVIELTPRGMNYGEGWAEGVHPTTRRNHIFPSNYVSSCSSLSVYS